MKCTFKPGNATSGLSGTPNMPKYFPRAFKTLQPKGVSVIAHATFIRDTLTRLTRKNKNNIKTIHHAILFCLPKLDKTINTIYFSIIESKKLSKETREFLNASDLDSEDEDLRREAVNISVSEAIAR